MCRCGSAPSASLSRCLCLCLCLWRSAITMPSAVAINLLLAVVGTTALMLAATVLFYLHLLVRAVVTPSYKPSRRLAVGLPVLAAIMVGVFLSVGLPLGEGLLNGVVSDDDAIGAVTAESMQFHRSLPIVDLHADPLLWTYRSLRSRSSVGHSDIPRLLEGNVAIQVFSTVSHSPVNINFHSNTNTTDTIGVAAAVQRWPVAAWTSKLARAVHCASTLHEQAAASEGRLRVIKSAADLESAVQDWQAEAELRIKQTAVGSVSPPPRFLGGILGVEGMQCAEGVLENFDVLFDAGVRVMGITHFSDNELGGSATGEEKHGLTELGRQMVKKMEERGALVDLAHASVAVVDDVLAMATKPVIVSHTGLRGACELPRNLLDRQAVEIAKQGGVVGITFFKAAVCGTKVADIVRSIKYAVDLIGIDHVGIGSDFDGGVKVPFDASHMSALTHALLSEGFSQEEIGKITGGNSLRVLRAVLK